MSTRRRWEYKYLQPTMSPAEFCRRRQRLGLTQEQLAPYLEISRSQVARLELGTSSMPPGMKLAFEGLEDRRISEGWELADNPLDYRVIKHQGKFFRYPRDRNMPEGATEIEGTTGEDGLLYAEYKNLPLVFLFPAFAKHRFQFTPPRQTYRRVTTTESQPTETPTKEMIQSHE